VQHGAKRRLARQELPMISIQSRCQRFRASLSAAFGVLLALTPAAFAQDAKAFRDEAAQAVAATRYVDALAAYGHAIAAAPDDTAAYAARAQLFVVLGHNDLAARDYARVVKLKPDDAGSQGNLCWTLAQVNHDLDGALAACDAAIRLEPTNYDAFGKRGYVQLRRGKYAEAEKDFTRALELNSASPNEMFGLGLAMIHVGQAQQGRDIIASATLDSAGLVDAWGARGFGLRGEIRPARAVTTAGQPIATPQDYRLFTNNETESYVSLAIAGRCGRMVAPAKAAEWGQVAMDNSRLDWSGECRFGLIHGEGRLSGPGGTEARYVYGREIPAGEAGAALEDKLTLAYAAAEEALEP
jgi:Tfp pilus assembly protein PilF